MSVGLKVRIKRQAYRAHPAIREWTLVETITIWWLRATKGYRKESRDRTVMMAASLPRGWRIGHHTVEHVLMGKNLGNRLARILDV